MADHDTTPITETTPEPAGGNGVDGAVEADDTTEAGALAEVAEHTTTHTTHTSDDHQNGEHTSTNGEHATTTESSTTPPPPSDDQIVDAMREIIKSHNVSEITLRMLMGLLEKEFNQELTSRKAFVKEKIGVLVAEQSGEGEGEEEEEGEGEGEEAAGEEADTNGDEEGEGKEPEDLKMSKSEVEVQKLLMEQIKLGLGTGRVTRGKASGRAPPKPIKQKKRKSTDGEEGEESEPKKKKRASKANRPKNLSPSLAEFLGETEMTRPDVVKRLHVYFKEHNLQNPKNKRQILFDEKLQLVFKRKTTDYFQLNTLLTKHLTDPGELL